MEQVWDQAVAEYQNRLGKTNRPLAKSFDTLESLLQEVELWKNNCLDKTSVKRLESLRPLLDGLWDLDRCVQGFVKAGPKPFAVLSGSLTFALESCWKYSHHLDELADCLRLVSSSLPRLEAYSVIWSRELPDPLKRPLVEYCIEFIRFCSNAVSFFKKPLRRNILRTTLQEAHASQVERLIRLSNEAALSAQFAISVSLKEELARLASESSRTSADMLLGHYPFSNLPPVKADFFSREPELESLSSALSSDTTQDETAYVCIHGLAGSGKTQLALRFAHNSISAFDVVLWMSAETQSKLGESFREAAKGLGLVDEGVQQHIEQENHLRRWFKNTSKKGLNGPLVKWLVVFDNVEDPSFLQTYLPRTSAGSVIVTCREPRINSLLPCIRWTEVNLGPFSDEIATQFLLSRTLQSTALSVDSRRLAMSTSKEVGNHPLPLDMVGSYVQHCGLSFEVFLQSYQESKGEISIPRPVFGSETFNQQSVRETLALILQHLDPHATLLLQMLALLDADGVPMKLFFDNTRDKMLCEGPDILDDFPDLDEALGVPFNDVDGVLLPSIATLGHFSLITVDEHLQRIQCHRLVQVAVEESMQTKEILAVLNRLVFYTNASFPFQPDGQPLHSQWKACDEFSHNVVALVNSYRRHEGQIPAPILLSEVACRCSWYYYEKGQDATADTMANEQIDICRNALERGNHPGYSSWFVQDMISHQVNTKGAVAKRIPLPDHGLSLTAEVLKIRKSNCLEPNAEEGKWIAAASGNHALSLLAVGRAAEAIPILMELIERPDMQPNMDLYLCNLCHSLTKLGLFKEALEYANKAAEVITASWGSSSAQKARLLHHVSRVYEGLEEPMKALEALSECVRIREAIMSNHPDTGFSLHRMGVLFHKLGHPSLAIHYLSSAYQILIECECHPGAICRTALALSRAYRECNRDQGARNFTIKGWLFKSKIKDISINELGNEVSEYDRFVCVCSR